MLLTDGFTPFGSLVQNDFGKGDVPILIVFMVVVVVVFVITLLRTLLCRNFLFSELACPYIFFRSEPHYHFQDDPSENNLPQYPT